MKFSKVTRCVSVVVCVRNCFYYLIYNIAEFHARTHTDARKHTHTYAHARTHTRTHAHTHTHTNLFLPRAAPSTFMFAGVTSLLILCISAMSIVAKKGTTVSAFLSHQQELFLLSFASLTAGGKSQNLACYKTYDVN
jgi:hypothetical protein